MSISTSSTSTATTTLSSKCSICFTAPPKYRCPRCSARTCSLNCVRTHKSRSLCSGTRDATTYLSRRQLATEKAFDSDFNLLSGIERGVEKAERVFAAPVTNLTAERRLRRAVELAGVRVWQAPKGVKRARENRTVLDGRRQCIRWSIEWRFLGLGIVSSASETASLVEAHDIAVLDAYTSTSDSAGKRRIEEYAKSVGVLVPSGYKGRKDLVGILGVSELQKSAAEQEHIKGDELAVDSNVNDSIKEGGDLNGLTGASEPLISEAALLSQKQTNPQSIATATRRIFIHRPEASSAKKQITSLVDGLSSLRDILKGKTVREFPTFLVEVPGSDEIDRTQWHIQDDIGSSQT